MKIVIDIDENVYTRLFDAGGNTMRDMRVACSAIRKGTPLPKGHGRLIDADAIPYTMLYKENFMTGTGMEKQAVWKDDIDRMPTIEPERKKLTNKEWIDFLIDQFDVSRTSAKSMLHCMMQGKREDNFKKQFSGGNYEKG